ncbi:M20 aminoacylase family protein [Roseovarius sp. PS-C2]|uniref:M20 aminoacylase family protein n=1 Tax=Roseovarius sp. PS-C2 TaxID=2820814 RepID=UPI00345FFBF5
MMLDDSFFADSHPKWIEWRRDLHMHPELAYQEYRTSERVAERLAQMGVTVHRGYGGTGVVGVLKNGDGPNIGLRADMDALPITEETQAPYRSATEGVMHACGHDGHTTMLLAAAEYLALTKRFYGTVTFIFQPAEECEAGARRMIEDGLFADHPVDEVYALHNWPGLAPGEFSVRPGAQMAGFDTFDIVVTGRGGHAAMPHECSDSILAAGQLVGALQSIVSRTVDPQSPAVLSVTQIHAGDAYNVLPETVRLAGCTRFFDKAVKQALERRIGEICAGVAAQHGMEITLDYKAVYPPTLNHAASQEKAVKAATLIAGGGAVHGDHNPSMASEDFAFILEQVPGAYLWLGNGAVSDFGALHSPHYDFNDSILPIGARFFAALVEAANR